MKVLYLNKPFIRRFGGLYTPWGLSTKVSQRMMYLCEEGIRRRSVSTDSCSPGSQALPEGRHDDSLCRRDVVHDQNGP